MDRSTQNFNTTFLDILFDKNRIFLGNTAFGKDQNFD